MGGGKPPAKRILIYVRERHLLTLKGNTKMDNYDQHVIEFWNWVERTIENHDYGLGRNNDGSFIKE